MMNFDDLEKNAQALFHFKNHLWIAFHEFALKSENGNIQKGRDNAAATSTDAGKM